MSASFFFAAPPFPPLKKKQETNHVPTAPESGKHASVSQRCSRCCGHQASQPLESFHALQISFFCHLSTVSNLDLSLSCPRSRSCNGRPASSSLNLISFSPCSFLPEPLDLPLGALDGCGGAGLLFALVLDWLAYTRSDAVPIYLPTVSGLLT